MTENLADLRQSLPDASPSPQPQTGDGLPAGGAENEKSFFAGLVARYGHSRSREQRQLAAVAVAVGETVAQQVGNARISCYTRMARAKMKFRVLSQWL